MPIKRLPLLLFFLFLYACAATAPTVVRNEGIVLGRSKKKIDLYFSKQNNDSGHWQARLLFETLGKGTIERIYLYRWRPKSLFMWQRPGFSSYRLTFLDGRLTEQEIWASNQNSDISPQCRMAIVRNRKDEFFIHC
ncbi:MAG: hypothetical protein ACE5GK_11865 [Nitrospiria bacterium]